MEGILFVSFNVQSNVRGLTGLNVLLSSRILWYLHYRVC